RHALSVGFRLGYEPIHFVNRSWGARRRCWVHQAGVDRFHETREVAIEMILLKECHQEAMRTVRVPGADADRAKQYAVLRMPHDELPDAFPEQQQRAVVLLIFTPDERTAEFQRW